MKPRIMSKLTCCASKVIVVNDIIGSIKQVPISAKRKFLASLLVGYCVTEIVKCRCQWHNLTMARRAESMDRVV